jgi:adenosylmethionine-8-amino-7-oxononanoate aminotransferase
MEGIMDDRAAANFLKENNARHYWHPMADPKQMEANPPLILAGGEGLYIWDVDGTRYLDLMGGLWNVNVGHGRDEIKQAIIAQLDKLSYHNTFNGLANPPSIELSAKLTQLLAPEGMNKVMFGSGGSDANETAFKIARQFWKVMEQPDKVKFISLRNGYHGMQFGALSASGGMVWRRAYEPLMPGFYQIDNPDPYRNPWTDDPHELGRICAAILDREIKHQGAGTVAAFIAEPIQGAGGMIIPPENYWPLVREVCDKHDVLLIADEVVTGFGRTGAMFGSRGWGVKPDIISLAKGINSGYVPLGATVFNERIAEAWTRDHPLAAIMHGYTYAGHPLACAAACANIDIVVNENLTDNAAKVGKHFLNRLLELKDRHEVIGDVRGRGLMLAIEFVKDRETKEPFAPDDPFITGLGPRCLERGVLVRTQAHRVVLSPPLTFTEDAAAEAADALDGALDGALSE